MYLQTEAKCPYCHGQLAKPPARKAKCLHCGEHYLVRTSPADRVKVIVTAQEADAIEQEWAVRAVLGSREQWEEQLKRIPSNAPAYERPRLEAMIARANVQYDQAWGKFNEARMKAAQEGLFGIYRNLTHEMSEQLWAEGKKRQALTTLVEVSYYDICGCTNAGTMIDGDRRVPFGRTWTPESVSLAPGLVTITRDWVEEVGMEEPDFRTLMAEHLKAVASGLDAPLTPEEALPALVEVAYGDKPFDEISLPKGTYIVPPSQGLLELRKASAAEKQPKKRASTKKPVKAGCGSVLVILVTLCVVAVQLLT